MKKLLTFLLTLCVAITGVLGTSVVVFRGDIYAETQTVDKKNSEDKSVEEQASADESQVASGSERVANTDIGDPYLVEVRAGDIKDGTYDIETKDSSAMFNIVSAKLTVASGKMTALITLHGKGYMKLFMGSGYEAVKAPETEHSMYKEIDGMYAYEVPVEALNKPLECTAYSFNRKKWYDHQIIFFADSLPKDVVKTDLKANLLDKEDGEYTADVKVVTENKETKKLTLKSPVKINIKGGKASGTLVFEQSDLDYLIAYGRKYFIKAGGDDSGFEIPIGYFDKEIKIFVAGKDTKYGEETAYSLIFDKSSIRKSGFGAVKTGLIVIAVSAGILIAILLVRKSKKTAK